MYRIRIDDTAKFNSFLTLTDKEYIDFYFQQSSCFAVNNSVEVFGFLKFKFECYGNEKNYTCRIERALLQKLIIQGYLDFTFKDSYVFVDFVTDVKNVLYGIKCRWQEVYANDYKEKIALIDTLDQYISFNGAEFSKLCTIAKASKGIISVEDSIANIQLNHRIQIFKRVECPVNFSISSTALHVLLQFSTQLINVQNYLGVLGSDFIILATKCFANQQIDFNELENMRDLVRCDLDIGGLKAILAKLDFKSDVITLDFNNKTVLLQHGRTDFSVPFQVKNLEVGPNYKFDKVEIPTVLFKFIFSKMGYTFKFSKKKTFIRLEQNGLVIFL